jgi:hypothetical protein
MSDDDDDADNLFSDAMDEDEDEPEVQNHVREEPVEGEDNTFHAVRLRQSQQQQQQQRAAPQPPPPSSSAVERDQLIPFQQPMQDPREMPVSYVVTDAVALYGNVSLWVLMYGQATRGIVAPVLCDAERGTL